MALSWSQIPHVSNQDLADITKLEAFRRKQKTKIAEKGGNLTLTVFALKAVVTALKAYPYFNSSLDTNSGEIILKNYYHIGVAVNSNEGLMVPVIRDVDRKSISQLAIELFDMAARARERKIAIEELQGGTFTITNAGPMGGGYFSPIINYPEAAILGLGQARMQPVVRQNNDGNQEIVIRLMMPVVLCFDHRVVDGVDAIRFTRMVIEALEDPEELFLNMV
jgi:pyruvate dehydrogenase E2 component (dihydrolipoamide acetyltransferase)